MADITGITIIRNGNILGYPWKLCLESMLNLCERVIVNCDPGEDNTLEQLRVLSRHYPVTVIPNFWKMHNTGDGSELAIQVNNILDYADTPWILYLQADELIHEADAEDIHAILDGAPSHITQIEMLRTYFWKSLDRRYKPYEIYLGRIFRTGTHEVGGDGMHLVRYTGEVLRTNKLIYHYSRMGTEEQITNRIRILDGLFHPPEVVQNFEPFSYNEIDKNDLICYDGSHPKGIREIYA